MTPLRILAMAAAAVVLGSAGAALGPASPAAASPLAAAEAAAPPEGAAITSVVANGSGCRQGDGVTASWTDASQLKVTYGKLAASVGGSSGPLDFRRNCQLSVQLEIPDGYAVALSSSTSLLYADVAGGATATHSAIADWGGMPVQNTWSRAVKGPFEDSVASSWNPDPSSLIFSSCDSRRVLSINQMLRVARGTSAPGVYSAVEFDSSRGGANSVYQLTWKRCAA